MKEVKTVCLGQPIIWSMAAVPKLHNSIVAVRMHPGAIPLAMITMRKSIHGFPLLSYILMGLRYKTCCIGHRTIYHRDIFYTKSEAIENFLTANLFQIAREFDYLLLITHSI